MENRNYQRLKLTIACRRYLDAVLQAKEEKDMRELENTIADAVVPLSFMNDLEAMQEEEEYADTH